MKRSSVFKQTEEYRAKRAASMDYSGESQDMNNLSEEDIEVISATVDSPFDVRIN